MFFLMIVNNSLRKLDIINIHHLNYFISLYETIQEKSTSKGINRETQGETILCINNSVY